MELLKKAPCWMKVGAALFALIFLFNWPASSGEWAAWVQAAGVIAAVVVGFASSALDRRRAQVDRAEFLISAVLDLNYFLETVEEAMEVRDPDTGNPIISKPGGIPTEMLRSTLHIIEEADLSGLPFNIVKDLRGAITAAHEYADAFDAESDSVEDALRTAFKIYDIHTPKRAVQAALSAVQIRRSEIQAKPLFSLS